MLLPLQLTIILPAYCVVGGGVLNIDGITVYSYYTRANIEISFDNYVWVEFAGALGALLVYVSDKCSFPTTCTTCMAVLLSITCSGSMQSCG